MHNWFSFHRLFNVIINTPEKKNDMTMSVCAEKPCEKFQHSFMTKKTSRKKEIEVSFLNLTKNFHKKPTVTIIFNGERLTSRPAIAA